MSAGTYYPSDSRDHTYAASCTVRLVRRTSKSTPCWPSGDARTGGHFGCHDESHIWTSSHCAGLFMCGNGAVKMCSSRNCTCPTPCPTASTDADEPQEARPTCFIFLNAPHTGGASVREIFRLNDYTVTSAKKTNSAFAALSSLSHNICSQRQLLEIRGAAHSPQLWAQIAQTRSRLQHNGTKLVVITLWRSPLNLVSSVYHHQCGVLEAGRCHDGPPSANAMVATVRRDMQCGYLLGMWGACPGWTDVTNPACANLSVPTALECESALGSLLHHSDFVGTTEALPQSLYCLNKTHENLMLEHIPNASLNIDSWHVGPDHLNASQQTALRLLLRNDVWMDSVVRRLRLHACPSQAPPSPPLPARVSARRTLPCKSE